MDRKIRRNESNDKKIDCKARDNGDSKKPNTSEGNMKTVNFEQGDSGERKILPTNKNIEQMRLKFERKKTTNEDPKSKYLTHGTAERDFPRKTYDKDLLGKSYSEIRKRIRDKYTFKLNVPVNKSDHLSLYKNRKGGTLTLNSDGLNPPITIRVPSEPVEAPIKPQPKETSRTTEKQIHSKSVQSDLDKIPDVIAEKKPEKVPEKKPEKVPENKPEKTPENKPEKTPVKPDKTAPRTGFKLNSEKKRRPIIKTVVSKTDSARIFKAVTFVDNINSTPLEIKIPGENTIIKKQQRVSKYTETSPLKFKPKHNLTTVRTVMSKASRDSIRKVEEKATPAVVRSRAGRRRNRKFRNVSPEFSILEPACPPTEVAKWAPASIDPQTIPYYEAWVDTTLAATSKHSKKDKYLYEYQARLLKNFKRAMEERPETPDLFYAKFADEKYAGRIKIRQTERHERRGRA